MLRRVLRLDVAICALVFLAGACSGNDARRCKVTAPDTGDVRIACPGSPALTVPVGADGSFLPDECELIEDLESGTQELLCLGRSVELESCGVGLSEPIVLGTEEDILNQYLEGVTPDSNALAVQRLLDPECGRTSGTVYVTANATDTHPEVLERLEIAGVIEFLAPVNGLNFPNLISAGFVFNEYIESWSTLEAPKLVSGSMIAQGGNINGVLSTKGLQRAYIQITDVEGFTSFEGPELVSGSIQITQAPDIVQARFPKLTSAGDFSFYEAPLLSSVEAPALTSLVAASFIGTPGLTTLSFPRLQTIASLFAIDGIQGLTGLSFPELRRLGTLNLNSLSSLGNLALPKLESASNLWLARLHALQSLDVPNVRTISEELLLDTVGRDSNELLIRFPLLESIGSVTFETVRASQWSFPRLQTIRSRALTVATSSTRPASVIEFPNLKNAEVSIIANGSSNDPVLVIDLTNLERIFDFPTFNESDPVLHVVAAGGQKIDLRVANLHTNGPVYFDRVEFVSPLLWDSRFEGPLVLNQILDPTPLNLENIATTSLLFTGVGSEETPLTGPLSGVPIRLAEISSSVAYNFSFGLWEGGSLSFTGGRVSGVLDVIGGSVDDISIVMTGAAFTEDLLNVSLGETRSGYIVLNRGETSVVLGNRFERGDIDVTSNNLSVLVLPVYAEGTISANRGTLTESSLFIPPMVNEFITGEIRIQGSAADCPSYLHDTLPNVVWTILCP